jgi:PAS domain S-box-containing protein
MEDTHANHLVDACQDSACGVTPRLAVMMNTTVLGALLEYSPNPTWLADSDGRCIYANQKLRETTALSAAQLGDLSWPELVAEEDRQMSSSLWQEARIHHQPYRARFFLRARNSARGSAVAVDAVGMGLIALDGSEVWLFTAIVSPPSAKALPPVEVNLQMTLNALPAHAWYARASGALAFVNGPTADYLGLPSDHQLRFGAEFEAPSDAHLVFLHPEDQPTSSRNWADQIQTGRPRDDQFRILGGDGKYRWFLTRAEPLRDSDSKVKYWVGVNIDIDDKKRASEALDAARERIGRATQTAAIAELSASLSDRIVQPLAAVVANARAALNWLSCDNLNISQANAVLERVVRDGMSAGDIIHEMRQLFDHRPPSPRAIDLNTLIEQVISLQAPDICDTGVAIDCELNPDLPVAFADAAQIQQVLFNLLSDVCEAMGCSEEPKKLTLRTDFTDDHVSLEVENDGSCVTSVESLLEVVAADKSRGTVVALAISRSIIAAQGGTLETIRRGGSVRCVRIELPRLR